MPEKYHYHIMLMALCILLSGDHGNFVPLPQSYTRKSNAALRENIKKSCFIENRTQTQLFYFFIYPQSVKRPLGF